MIINHSFEEFVDAFRIVMPYLKDIIGKEMVVNISDTDRFIDYCGGRSFDLPVKPGERIASEDPMRAAIATKKQIIADVPKEAYGVPFKAVINPILDGAGHVSGVIGVGITKETEVLVSELTNNLEMSLEQVGGAVEQIAIAAGAVNQNEKRLNERIQQVSQLTGQIGNVLNAIKTVADQTKMLGLNAAIEAARAGEVGKGFGVVAEEIRKLSDESKKTADMIRTLTQQIDMNIAQTLKDSDDTLRAGEEQAAATEEITSSIQELASNAAELGRIAASL